MSLALLAALSSLVAGPELEYRLALAATDPDHPRVAISVRCQSDADGTTDFAVEKAWGGHENDGRDIGELRVTGKAGTPLPLVRGAAHAWSVTAPPGEPLTAEYVITETPPRGDDAVSEKAPGNDYRTRLDRQLFQTILHFSLLVPEHLRGEAKHNVAITLDGFASAGWQVMSSWGPGEGRFERTTSMGDLSNSLILAARDSAGRFVRSAIGKNEIGVAIIGQDWGFDDARFVDLASQIVRMERDFFADHSDPWFLITLTPEGGRAENGSFSLGGTGLNGAFALYCNTGLSLERGSPLGDQILFLLAHEYFHTWNGTKFAITDGSDRDAAYGAMWFSEGFTNYYARKLLRASGLIDDRTFTAKLNEAFAALDMNPHRDAPNSAIDGRFWTDRDIGQLPYQRGDIIALCADEAIREHSHGTRSLDDVLREIFTPSTDAKDGKSLNGVKEVNQAEVLARIEREVAPATAAMLRAAVVEGKPIDAPRRIANPALRLVVKQVRVSDPGFDMAATQARKEISGVREGSAAWRAGLRDGQALRSFSITTGADRDHPPHGRVEVVIDGSVKTIEYEPLSDPREVRAYEAADAASKE